MWHRLALDRRGLEEAAHDLRQLNNLHAAIGSALSKDGVKAFNATVSRLLAKLNGTATNPEDATANRRAVFNRLLKMGATRGWEKAA